MCLPGNISTNNCILLLVASSVSRAGTIHLQPDPWGKNRKEALFSLWITFCSSILSGLRQAFDLGWALVPVPPSHAAHLSSERFPSSSVWNFDGVKLSIPGVSIRLGFYLLSLCVFILVSLPLCPEPWLPFGLSFSVLFPILSLMSLCLPLIFISSPLL